MTAKNYHTKNGVSAAGKAGKGKVKQLNNMKITFISLFVSFGDIIILTAVAWCGTEREFVTFFI